MGGGGNTLTRRSKGMSGMSRCQSCMELASSQQQQQQEEQQECPPTCCEHSRSRRQSDYGDLEPTSLFLSSSPTSVRDTAVDVSSSSPPERLYLPRRNGDGSSSAPCALDVYLSSLPSVASRAHELFQQDDILPQAATALKCVNVLQGEVAHAATDHPNAPDLLVSAEATTCHVVALRSTDNSSSADSSSVPLCSMAHMDGVYYDCLERILQTHIHHHTLRRRVQDQDDFGFYMGDEEAAVSKGGSADGSNSSDHHFLPTPHFPALTRRRSSAVLDGNDNGGERIAMELHIAGGYLDEAGTSQELTDSLLHTFSKLADKYQDQIQMSLSTAAVSSLNNNNNGGPKSRGLALNIHTGQVHPITTALPSQLEGPALELRSARLWSSSRGSLSVIHNVSGQYSIEPFEYCAPPQNSGLDKLLHVPDDVLLQITSTSPKCESERFCSDMRRTLSFVTSVPSMESVFGQAGGGGQPIVYTRSATALNEWEPVGHDDQDVPSFRAPEPPLSF